MHVDGTQRWRAPAGLAAALALALLVRGVAVARAQNIARDGVRYLRMARYLAGAPTGEVLRAFDFPPGYPAAIAAAAKLLGLAWPVGWVAAGRWLAVAASLAALAAVYVIAAATFDRTVALISTTVLGLAPVLTATSADVLSDLPAGAPALWAVALALHAGRQVRAARWSAAVLAAAAGLAAGLGYLCRPEALATVPVGLLMLAMPRGLSRRGRVIQVVAVLGLLAAVAACTLPYASAVGGLTKKKSLEDFVGGGSPVVLAVAEGGVLRLLDSLRKALDRWRAIGGSWAAALTAIWWATWIGRYVLRLRLPPSVMVRPRADGVVAMFGVTCLLLPAVVALEFHRGPGYIDNRHMLMPALLMAVAAGAGLKTLVAWAMRLRRFRTRPRAEAALTAVGFVAVLGAMLLFAFPVVHRGKGVYRQAGRRIAEAGGGRVLAPEPTVPLYAAAPDDQFDPASPTWHRIEPADVASLSGLLGRVFDPRGRARVDFVAISSVLLRLSGNGGLIEALSADARFQPIAEFASELPDHHVWLFRVRPGRL